VLTIYKAFSGWLLPKVFSDKYLMKKILLSPWTALLTLVLIVGIRIADPTFVESVRLRYFDTLVTSQPAKDVPVYTVNIDEATLDKLGQFPFPRDMYADIIKDLYKRDAGLVVFNVLMPEKDRFGKDAVLGETLKKYPVVLPALGSERQKNTNHGTPAQVVGADPAGLVVEYPGLINNVEPQESLAAGVGVVNTFPEIDGVVRRMPLVILSQEQLHPALALETLRVAAKDPKFQIKIGDMGVEAVRVPKFGKIPTDEVGRVWIDWSATPREYSYMQLPESFDGGIVVVGLSAAGLANPISTARGEVWPQYLQGAVIGTMITQSNIQRPGWADQAEIIALLAAGLLMLFLSRWTYAFIPVVVFLGLSHFAISYLYENSRILLDATWFVVGCSLVYIHAYSVKFLSEYLQKSQIKKQFGSYVNPVIVERLQRDPSFIKLGGEKKELTVIMSDMRNFTGLGETYGDDVVAFTQTMNRYMTAIAEPILRNNGCLIKFIGDASLHVHGAPIQEEQDPDHVLAAVRTGLEMLHAVELFNIELEKEGKPKVGCGLGINTGPTLIGNIGSKDRFGYDVLGDSVSLTARLEGQTKNYGVLIIISESTQSRVEDAYFTLPLDCIAVKGKSIGVNIFTVFYNPDDTVAEQWHSAREHHELMLEYYREQNWDKAIELCQELVGEFYGNMDHYYELWIARIAEMRSRDLPTDWDGTYKATSK
jgi:adenylate cyclase